MDYHHDCITCDIVNCKLLIGYHNTWKFVEGLGKYHKEKTKETKKGNQSSSKAGSPTRAKKEPEFFLDTPVINYKNQGIYHEINLAQVEDKEKDIINLFAG